MASEGHFIGAAGRRIAFRSWLPEGEAQDHIVVAHGYAEHAGRYDAFGQWFAARGFGVHALDHHGHGQSGGARGVICSFDEAAADIDRLVDKVLGESGLVQVKLLGHSMGGSLALHYAIAHQDKLSGLILSGPAIGGGVSAPMNLVLRILATLAPRMGTVELDSNAVSRDPAVVEAYRADPLVTLGKVPARTAQQMMAAIARYPAQVGRLHVPLLYMHGSDDALVPQAPVQPVIDAIGSRDKTEIVYDGLYHEIFNEPERESIFATLERWLQDHPAR
ncbi:MAG: alpha/beta hydrolase [Sphingomonadales bacterium]|nr:alpha/beta hydrolase [Sphingomonadales bacterium]MBD3775298.1 alpha/beta hydrolase [Paracoccaceae bacterium]